MDSIEGGLQNLGVGQFLLNIEEVIEKLADISDCVGESDRPFGHFDIVSSVVDFRVDEESCSFEDVFVVFGVVENRKGFIVVFDVPI